jgi:hypothetical protein
MYIGTEVQRYRGTEVVLPIATAAYMEAMTRFRFFPSRRVIAAYLVASRVSMETFTDVRPGGRRMR